MRERQRKLHNNAIPSHGIMHSYIHTLIYIYWQFCIANSLWGDNASHYMAFCSSEKIQEIVIIRKLFNHKKEQLWAIGNNRKTFHKSRLWMIIWYIISDNILILSIIKWQKTRNTKKPEISCGCIVCLSLVLVWTWMFEYIRNDVTIQAICN